MLKFTPTTTLRAWDGTRHYEIEHHPGDINVDGTNYEYPVWIRENGEAEPFGTWGCLKSAMIACEMDSLQKSTTPNTTGLTLTLKEGHLMPLLRPCHVLTASAVDGPGLSITDVVNAYSRVKRLLESHAIEKDGFCWGRTANAVVIELLVPNPPAWLAGVIAGMIHDDDNEPHASTWLQAHSLPPGHRASPSDAGEEPMHYAICMNAGRTTNMPGNVFRYRSRHEIRWEDDEPLPAAEQTGPGRSASA